MSSSGKPYYLPRNSTRSYMFDDYMGWFTRIGMHGHFTPVQGLGYFPSKGAMVFYRDQSGAFVPAVLLDIKMCSGGTYGMYNCTIVRVHPPKHIFSVFAANVFIWTPPPPPKARL